MLTLVSVWYIFKPKFNIKIYQQWMSHLLLNVKEFKLVIFTNEESRWMIEPFLDPLHNSNHNNIKMIILEIEEFYGYKFKEQWIKNHLKNDLLNTKVDWRVNMLWCEKIAFVKRAIEHNYFAIQCDSEKEWVGWCDIGYFRGGANNMDVNKIKEWPNKQKIELLERNKIYYAQVCDNSQLNQLARIVLDKNITNGLPKNPIPVHQISIAGGFFLITPEKINWWNEVYYQRLNAYFENNYLVKDDQIIIIDCLINHLPNFKLIKETVPIMDQWFAFYNYLL